ncbi:MAG: prephenate dehydratase [Gemmatimonadota bacterium]|jgi:prephenate dehydratase
MERNRQPPLTVAIQGEPGSFSHMAAEQLFGPDLRLVPSRTFDALFEAVVSRRADRGLVPVENTLAGSVQGNLDGVLRHSVHAVAETRVRIRLCLVARPGMVLSAIRTAASHPVALQQCHTFFRRHPEMEPVAVYDTAGSIRDLMSGNASYDAAIGSELASRIYGAEIVQEEIEDDRENYTRFFAVSTEPGSDPGPRPKTSLAFVVAHEPGSLHRALGTFAHRGVDLTKLESRPISGRPWEYRFFADVRGDPRGDLAACLEELRGLAAEVHVLGTYPEWPGLAESSTGDT